MTDRTQRGATVRTGGAIVVLVAGLVLIGWHLQIDTLLRVLPFLPVIRYNAALGLLGLGLAVVAVGTHRPRIASGLALVPALLGAVTMIQYLTQAGLGVDELFMHDFVAAADATVRSGHPGRMAAGTAFCLTLTAIAVLITQRKRPRFNAAVVLCVLCAALAGANLVAFALGLDSDARHRVILDMAVPAAALLCLAASVVLYGMHAADERNDAHAYALGAGLAALILVVMIWQGLVSYEQQAIRRFIETQGIGVRDNSSIR